MMRYKTIKKRTKKLMEKVNRKVDNEMKEKYGDLYKTRAEKNREARQSKRRYEIMQIIFLIQNLQTTGQLNEEIRKLSAHLPSEFDRFLK